MAVLKIEAKRRELIEALKTGCSFNMSACLIAQFYAELFQHNHPLQTESYLHEFNDSFKLALNNYQVFCTSPHITGSIIKTAKQLLSLTSDEELEKIIRSVDDKLITLEKILTDEDAGNLPAGRASFPVIEENQQLNTNVTFAYLEEISVTIDQASGSTELVIVPSEKEIEERIKRQVELSWKSACRYAARYIKRISEHHKVIISFKKRYGWYVGDSLGVILTLLFIEEILKHYNAPVYFSVNKRTAFTGGLKESGKISSVTEEIIKSKVNAVFYSAAEQFVVPQEDKPAADSALSELHKSYPNRHLNITGVEDLDDILNRRNLVEIKKRSITERTWKAVKKNYATLLLVMIVAVLILFSGLWDFDNNPKVLKYENQHLKVYNSNRKLLWDINIGKISDEFYEGNSIKSNFAFLWDVNGNGNSEIIISESYLGFFKSNLTKWGNISCYDNKQNLVWQFNFNQPVSTQNINFSSEYRMDMYGVYEVRDRLLLLVAARNEYFPCAVFGIDISTGKMATDVFWHSGHMTGGFMFNDSINGSQKVLLAGVHNGFGSASAMIIEINKLKGQAPAPDNYKFKDISTAEMEGFILIPPTDFSIYNNNRYNAATAAHITHLKKDNLLRIGINENMRDGQMGTHLYYYFNPDLSINFIEMGDGFQHERDKLVKAGKLSPPLSYTEEYFNILRNNLMYWDGEKFVAYDELKDNQ